MRYFFLAIYVAVILVHLYACLPPYRIKLRRVTKLLLMPLLGCCFVAVRGEINILVGLALIFSFLGDAFLLFRARKRLFMAGLLSFGLAHIMYCVTFITMMGKLDLLTIIVCTMAYAMICGIVYARKLSRHFPKDLRAPGACYAALICADSLCALLLLISNRLPLLGIIFVGTLMFICSDTVLSMQYFKKSTKYGNFIVMATYIFAESCIVLGLALT